MHFLEVAHERGHTAFAGANDDCFGAISNRNGRFSEMIHRGGDRYWELRFGGGNELYFGCILNDFELASAFALRWLTGNSLAPLVQEVLLVPGARQVVPYVEQGPGVQTPASRSARAGSTEPPPTGDSNLRPG